MNVHNKAVKAAGLAATTMVALSVGTAASDQADPAANLVGPGCAACAQEVTTGPGSVAGMAQDPVAVAAGNNLVLTTF